MYMNENNVFFNNTHDYRIYNIDNLTNYTQRNLTYK